MFASLAILSLFNTLATWGGISAMTWGGIAAFGAGILHVVSVWGGIS